MGLVPRATVGCGPALSLAAFNPGVSPWVWGPDALLGPWQLELVCPGRTASTLLSWSPRG